MRWGIIKQQTGDYKLAAELFDKALTHATTEQAKSGGGLGPRAPCGCLLGGVVAGDWEQRLGNVDLLGCCQPLVIEVSIVRSPGNALKRTPGKIPKVQSSHF